MAKYEDSLSQIFSIFGSTAWKSQNIKTYPSNFVAKEATSEFIRVSVIPSGKGINLKSISGLLIIDIFVSAGDGPKKLFQIADKLDEYLCGKTVRTSSSNKVQMRDSSLSATKVDDDNPTICKASYSIPFNYFGVN